MTLGEVGVVVAGGVVGVAVEGGVVAEGVVGVAVEGGVVAGGVVVAAVTTENRGGGVSNTLYINCIYRCVRGCSLIRVCVMLTVCVTDREPWNGVLWWYISKHFRCF